LYFLSNCYQLDVFFYFVIIFLSQYVNERLSVDLWIR
jgi:hypothetical protein